MGKIKYIIVVLFLIFSINARVFFDFENGFKTLDNEKFSDNISGDFQYEIKKKGFGNFLKIYNSPIIKYKIYSLDKKSIFLKSSEKIDLNEISDFFKNILLNMKENERKIFYFHPSTFGLHPKLLKIIIDIEILQSDFHKTYEEMLKK